MQINFNSALSEHKNSLNFTGVNKSPNNTYSFINTDRMVDSFISMAKIDTGSNEEAAETKIPSTKSQTVFAEKLAGELKEIGLSDINIDEHSILTATLKGNVGDKTPIVGLLAHMDTSPAVPTSPVQPRIHDYKDGNIKLEGGTVISEADLKEFVGYKIITSDGRTLLGADDKAGIAEILESLKVFLEHPELKRPDIRVAFTPDEENGLGIDKFNIKKFGADLAYTVDGGLSHILETESFNAFNPEIVINGINVHPGYAKDKMVNSMKIGSWIISKLPDNEAPETTSGREGYYHVYKINGTEEKTTLNLLVRDHDYEQALKRVKFVEDIVNQAKENNPKASISFNPKPAYRNMGDEMKKFPAVVQFAVEGMKRAGINNPIFEAIRGGTDGSQLSLKGLLTPNLAAGGENFHAKNEFISIVEMKKCTANIIEIMRVWGENAVKIMPEILKRRI